MMERSPVTLNLASLMMNRDFDDAGIHPILDLKWLAILVPIQSSTESFLGGLCLLHNVDPVQ
jgi:hypothetical protein